MWFKNLRIYQFSDTFHLPTDLAERLEEGRFVPCSRQEPSSFGWVAPVGEAEDAPLFHQTGDFILLCARKEDKVIPASAVQSRLDDKKAEFEQENARPMPRKEQKALKEDITEQLLPQALSRYSVLWALVDLKGQRILVNTSASARSEELTGLLRQCLGSLPVRPWGAEQPGRNHFTHWVSEGQAPTPFELGDEAELRSASDEGGLIRLRQHALDTAEVQAHLNDQKLVTEIGLDWADHLSFVLTDDFVIKRLKFADMVLDQRDDDHADDHAARLDADFVLMAHEFHALLNELAAVLEIVPTHSATPTEAPV